MLERALRGDGPAIVPSPPGAGSGSSPALPAEVDERVAVVVETSGSTAAPKRVALSAEALLASADATHAALGGAGEWLLALPLHYIAGVMVVVRSLRAGTRLITGGPAGSAEAIVDLAEGAGRRRGRRYAAIVPAQLRELVDRAGRERRAAAALAGVDAFLVGGQRTDPALRLAALAAGVRVVATYGSSETAGGCVYDGRPIGDTRVRIDDDGRVRLSGSGLAEGYLSAAGLVTRDFLLDAAGVRWWRSSDLGRLDDGVLSVLGRMDGVVISGGIKILLAEVEEVVRELPGLSTAIVVAAPDPRWGQVPVVFAAGNGDGRADLVAVRAAVAARLRPEARPRALVLLADGIPQTSTGKPDRARLRRMAERLESAGDGDVEREGIRP